MSAIPIWAMGSVGIGLVWGWLLAAHPIPAALRPRTTAVLGVAALGQAFEAGILNGAWAGVLLGFATLLGLGLHLAWMSELRSRRVSLRR